MLNLIQFINDQEKELLNDGFFKTYTHCINCGTKYIFKNFNLKTKKVCVCLSNEWVIDHVKEC